MVTIADSYICYPLRLLPLMLLATIWVEYSECGVKPYFGHLFVKVALVHLFETLKCVCKYTIL